MPDRCVRRFVIWIDSGLSFRKNHKISNLNRKQPWAFSHPSQNMTLTDKGEHGRQDFCRSKEIAALLPLRRVEPLAGDWFIVEWLISIYIIWYRRYVKMIKDTVYRYLPNDSLYDSRTRLWKSMNARTSCMNKWDACRCSTTCVEELTTKKRYEPLCYMYLVQSQRVRARPSNVWPQDLSIFRCFNVVLSSMIWWTLVVKQRFFAQVPSALCPPQAQAYPDVHQNSSTAGTSIDHFIGFRRIPAAQHDPLPVPVDHFGANVPRSGHKHQLGNAQSHARTWTRWGWGVLDGLEAHFFLPEVGSLCRSGKCLMLHGLMDWL